MGECFWSSEASGQLNTQRFSPCVCTMSSNVYLNSHISSESNPIRSKAMPLVKPTGACSEEEENSRMLLHLRDELQIQMLQCQTRWQKKVPKIMLVLEYNPTLGPFTSVTLFSRVTLHQATPPPKKESCGQQVQSWSHCLLTTHLWSNKWKTLLSNCRCLSACENLTAQQRHVITKL